MKIRTDSLGSNHPRPIPPLSQSRHGDKACETLYVFTHVQGAMAGDPNLRLSGRNACDLQNTEAR